ncbi:MAG: zinc-binding alcohol dehydrogenase [Lentisphaeria bacterium]|jgi:2-desacetyl-2-hydroxyethyl bacteriochlorophyllide A dehydrogenase|nr:zinc-binding alcohol dehydrogenase [Lentisphaeria bacterium]
MKGIRIVWPAPGQAAVEEFDIPAPTPDTVLLETECSVLSAGTEKAWLLAKPNTSGQFPQYPGYSAAGRVLDVGANVKEFHPGDRVVAYHSAHASHTVKHPRDLVRIEDAAVPANEAAFTIIAAMSLQGVRKARIELGETVLVMGQGLLGLFATQLARLSGGLPTIALDLDEKRRRLAIELGADHALSPQAGDFTETFRALTGGKGANAVIEVTGVAAAMNLALECAAGQGRIVALGCSREKADGVDFYQQVHKPGVAIIGAHNFVRPAHDSSPGHWTMRDDLRALLRMIAAGRLHVRPMISEQVSPEQAPAIYRRLVETDCPPLGIVFGWQDKEPKP